MRSLRGAWHTTAGLLLIGCGSTGASDAPDYATALLGRWEYSATFAFEKAFAPGDTVTCMIDAAELQMTEPISHDDDLLNSTYRPRASFTAGTMQCTGASSFEVNLVQGTREPSALATGLDVEIRFKVLTPNGTITVSSVAWRSGGSSDDLVSANTLRGRVWSSNGTSYAGPPFDHDGTFEANKQ